MENNTETLRCVSLPAGYILKVCPVCKGKHLVGALINENASEEDPNIICKDCGNIVD